MPTIRDLVAAIRDHQGVEAAVVLGRDGLVIDGQSADHVGAEDLAAHLPGVVNAADDFGNAAGRGGLTTGVLEYPTGTAIVSVVSPDAMLLVLLKPGANLGQLLFEIRRNRQHIAALV